MSIILDHFPEWQSKHYPGIQACIKAVDDKKADCVLITYYQYNSLAKTCRKYDLVPLATGEYTDLLFALNVGDNDLYSILTRTTNLVSNTAINAALSYYSSEDTSLSVIEFIRHTVLDVSKVHYHAIMVQLFCLAVNGYLPIVAVHLRALAGVVQLQPMRPGHLESLLNVIHFYASYCVGSVIPASAKASLRSVQVPQVPQWCTPPR